MPKYICLNLSEVKYEGDSIGRDIQVEIKILGATFKIDKRISRGETKKINQNIGCFKTDKNFLETDISISVTEKDLIFSDSGAINENIELDISKNFPQKLQYSVSVTERRKVFWKKTAIFKIILEAKSDINETDTNLKQYQSPNPQHDYNRFDNEILTAVKKWNKEFSAQDNPPPKLLDPNLVKAIIYVESAMGYGSYVSYPSFPDVMQVGDPRNQAIHILHDDGKWPAEYEVNSKNLKKLFYPEASSKTPGESIIWGTRWLYHKAQSNIDQGKNWESKWLSWFEAVEKYNGRKSYFKNVKRVYVDGIDPRTGNKLWIITTLLFFLFIGSYSFVVSDTGQELFYPSEKNQTLAEQIMKNWPPSKEKSINNIINNSGKENLSFKRRILESYSAERLTEMENIQVSFYNQSIFYAVIGWQKDWREDLKIGKLQNDKIVWLDITNRPNEQSILSAKFVSLKGITDPVLEVYGETHMGNGDIYLYRVGENEASLLFNTSAVDEHNEYLWRPGGYPEYGHYSTCGEVYKGGRLTADYKDLNNDGVSDIILSGKTEVICEKAESHDPLITTEVKAAEIPVRLAYFIK